MPRFKSIIFYKNSSKIKLILQKNAKFLSAWGSTPWPPCLRRLEALPQTPSLRRQGDSPPHARWPPTPRGSDSWGLRPQTPKTAPPLQIFGYAPGHRHFSSVLRQRRNTGLGYHCIEPFCCALISLILSAEQNRVGESYPGQND